MNLWLLLIVWILAGCSAPASEPTVSQASALAAVDASVPVATAMARMPGGRTTLANCVHAVPQGGMVDGHGNVYDANKKMMASYGDCSVHNAAGAGNGSIEDVTAQAPGGALTQFTAVDTTWTVPEKPVFQNDGQAIALWNGLEPAGTAFLLQPVLIWGYFNGGTNNVIGSYSTWTICPLLSETNGQFYSGPCQAVSPGDKVEGEMYYDEEYESEELWGVGIRDLTKGTAWQAEYGLYPIYTQWIYAIGATLEAYVNAAGDFPAPQCTASNQWSYATVWDQNEQVVQQPGWNYCVLNKSSNYTACVLDDNYTGIQCGFFSKLYGNNWYLGF